LWPGAAARIPDLAVSLGALQAPSEAADCFGACLTSQLKDAVMCLDFLSLSRSSGAIWQVPAPCWPRTAAAPWLWSPA
jgi:hypothetical protein